MLDLRVKNRAGPGLLAAARLGKPLQARKVLALLPRVRRRVALQPRVLKPLVLGPKAASKRAPCLREKSNFLPKWQMCSPRFRPLWRCVMCVPVPRTVLAALASRAAVAAGRARWTLTPSCSAFVKTWPKKSMPEKPK